MRKNILMASAIVFMGLFAASCSDSDKNREEIEEAEAYNVKNSPEYARYGLPKHGLVSDVKTVASTQYLTGWDTETETIKVGGEMSKIEYAFDNNGFLTSQVGYESVWLETEEKSVLRASNKGVRKYDNTYRVIETEWIVYDAKSDNNEILKHSKSNYVYDNESKEVAIMYFEKNEEGAFVASNKEVYPLDANNRFDEKAAGYTKYFGAKYKEEELGRKLRTEEAKPNEVREEEYFVSKDKKGNAILTYLYTRNKFGESNDYKHIKNYTKSEITYYDGTTSSVDKSEQNIVGGYFVAQRLDGLGLKGNVKSLKTAGYSGSKWNEKTQTLIKGSTSGKYVDNFDDKGVLVSTDEYGLVDDELVLISKSTYKYDAQFRITEQIKTSFNFYDGKEYSSVARTVATYNDAAKTAKMEGYRKQNSEGEEVLEYTRVHKLATDGTISNGNLEGYAPKPEQRSLAVVDPFEEDPYMIVTHIVSNDANGNWTERYELEKDYDGKEYIEAYVSGHLTQEITYY